MRAYEFILLETHTVPGLGSLPNPPGTTPIPPGTVRLYHQTSEDALKSIVRSGLTLKHARGIEGPYGIYASKTGFYGAPGTRPTLEFWVNETKFQDPFVLEDVPVEQMIAAHLPWHLKARYIETHPKIKQEVLSGKFDNLISKNTDYGPAVVYIKGLNANLNEGWKTKAGAAALALGAIGASMMPATNVNVPTNIHVPTRVVQKTKAPTVPLLSKNTATESVLHRAATSAGIVGVELAQFLAQCAHETGDFVHMSEIGGHKYFSKKYDPKHAPSTAKIIGNTRAGDGVKFAGRGFIQITGRENYRRASDALGIDLVSHPELAARPQIAAKIAIWFWKTRVRPSVTNFKDTAAVTRKINPALKGLGERKATFAAYSKNLNADT